MKLTADDQGRLACAELFPPRSTFDATRQPDGSVRVLELVEKESHPAKVRFEQRSGHTVGFTDQPISLAAIQAALADFP